MEGKRSNTVVFLLLSMISFSNGEPPFETLLVSDDDARLALHQTAASNPDSVSYSDTQLNGSILSMEMLHREVIFPSAEEEMGRSEIMKIRLNRDRTRVASLSSRATTANGAVISGLSMGSSEYFTRLAVGTPPQHFYMVLDTGSDVTWLQCQPCELCYNQTDPIFNRTSSKTYLELSCESETCKLLDTYSCSKQENKCQYEVVYADDSYTMGDFATETLTIGNSSSVSGIAIGCGYNNKGSFVAAAGLLGLGGGKLSFPNQATNYGRQFSYCLVSRGSEDTSFITFGQTPVSKENSFTPMIINNAIGYDTFYYVNLTQISVGGAPVKGVTSAISIIDKSGNGGVMVDSGTVITRLEVSAYYAVSAAFQNASIKYKLKPVSPPDGITLFDTCYDFSGLTNVTVPTVVLHFDGKAEMALPADNYLIRLDAKGTFCFAFAPYKGMSIIGNLQQQGFRVTYDLEGKRIGFAPRSC